MLLSTVGHRRLTLRALVVVVLSAAIAVWGAVAASAAIIPNSGGNGFLDPHTTSTTVTEFQRVQLTSKFHVPDTAVAGDQIVIALPEALLAKSFQNFDVLTPAGKVLGVATLGTDAAGKPALVVTFNDLVEGADAQGTSGSLTFGLRIDRSRLDFSTGDSDTIDVWGGPVTVTHVGGRENTRKTGSWIPNQATATATNADGQLIRTERQMTWRIAIKPGAWKTTTISEGPQVGYVTNCTGVKQSTKGFLLEVSGDGGFTTVPASGPAKLTVQSCNADGSFALTVTKPTDDPAYYRVSYSADLTTDDQGRPVYVDENGNTVVGFPPSYTNSASVTVGTEETVTVEASLLARNGQGEGQNITEPLIDIEKYSAATVWSGVAFDTFGHPFVTAGPAWEPTNQPAEDFDAAPGKLLAVGAPQLVRFTVTNIGSEPLRDLVVGDVTGAGPALTGVSCNFTPYGGPATGTTGGAAVLPRQKSILCTGTLPALAAGVAHADTATVTAVGTRSGRSVSDADAWYAHTPPKKVEVGGITVTRPPTAVAPGSAVPTLPATGVTSATLPITVVGLGAVLLGGLFLGLSRGGAGGLARRMRRRA